MKWLVDCFVRLFLASCIISSSTVDSQRTAVECPAGCEVDKCRCSEDETGEGLFVICEGLTGSFKTCLEVKVIEFQLHNSTLTSIGPDDFPAESRLEFLDITGNFKLETLDEHAFRELKSLRRILLEHNSLTKLEKAIFPVDAALEEIRLSNNKIDRILHESVFAGLEGSLRDLRLGYNRLEGFVCPRLHKLNALDLRENRIRALEREAFRECPHLIEINLSGNLLKDVKVNWTSLRELHTLDLNDNEIVEVEKDFQETLPNLRYLTIAFNQLRSIPPLPTKLMGLELTGNLFETIRERAFENLTQLNYLDLSDLPELTTIEESAFAGLRYLTRIVIGFNRKLSSLPRYPWPESRDLHEISLFANNISVFHRSLFEELDSLWAVNIEGNPIHCSCDNSWIRVEMDNEDFPWIYPWKNGSRAVRCRTPINLDGFLISQLNDYDLTCSLSRVVEHSLTTTSEGAILQAVLIEGVPSTSWYFPDGRHVWAHREKGAQLQAEPRVEEILWENLTILARLTLTNSDLVPGQYILEWINAAGFDNYTYTVGGSPNTPSPPAGGSNPAVIAVTILSIGMVILFAVGGYFLYRYLRSRRVNSIRPMEEDAEDMSSAVVHVQNEPDGSSLLTPTAGYGSTSDTTSIK